MKKLSLKQRRILEYLKEYLQDHGYPPSIREIQTGCGISSTSVVDYNLRILQREGHLHRSREISRGIELLDGAGRFSPGHMAVPLVGAIAAGEPIPVPDADSWQGMEPLETLDLPVSLVRSQRPVFALRVRGLSMIDALIDDGDIVLLESPEEVQNGDMVAVWLKLEREVTLKHLYNEGERIRLQPANEQMEPRYTTPDNVEVQGRVVGVLRQVR